MARVVDLFDQSRDYDQVREDMRKGEAQRKEDRKNNPISATLDEVEGVIKGGALGAAESALGAAEVVGDTVQTAVQFATLQDVSNSKNNPFSSCV